MTQQEWLMQQQGLLGGARPIPGMFSNAQMLGGARGGGGMPMGMSSTTTGEDPLGPPPEDPMTTAMKMHYMYKGGQKGKEYIGDAWDWGKKQLGQQAVDINQIASATTPAPQQMMGKGAWLPSPTPTELANQQMADYQSAVEGSNPNFYTPTHPNLNPSIPSTPGATRGFAPSQNIFSDPRTSQGLYQDPAGSLDAFGGTANIENTGFFPSTADPLKSGAISEQFFGTNPGQGSNWGGMFPSGATGTVDAAGIFSPSAGTIAESGGLLGTGGLDTLGSGGMYAGTGGQELLAGNVPKGAGGSALGGIGAAAGVGLNIYDMTQQGITPGNVMGLGGSALLGANALGFGLANAWNPLGWALLAGSVAGSLFDWW